jgi:hypothetical protein
MTPEAFEKIEKLHDAFREAAVALFRNTAGLDPEGLPFIVRVDDQHGVQGFGSLWRGTEKPERALTRSTILLPAEATQGGPVRT